MLDTARLTYDPPNADACAEFVRHLITCRVADMAIAFRDTGNLDREQLEDTALWAAELSDADLPTIRGNLLSAIGRRADKLNRRTSEKYLLFQLDRGVTSLGMSAFGC